LPSFEQTHAQFIKKEGVYQYLVNFTEIKKSQLEVRKYLLYIRMSIPNHLRVSGHDEEKFTLNVFCSPVEKKSEGWVLPTAWLGKRGKFGSIAQVCKSNRNCGYVMKVVSIRTNPSEIHDLEFGTESVTREKFLNEVELQKEAAKENIAPPIIEYWICKDPSVGVIIMPMLDKTLKDVWTDSSVSVDQKELYKSEANALLSKLNKLKIQHGDSHTENFMFDKQGKLKLIDFGMSQIIDPCYFNLDQGIVTWVIPSSQRAYASFSGFFKDMKNIQNNLPSGKRGQRVFAQRYRRVIDKHRQNYNAEKKFKIVPATHPQIDTWEEYIQTLCARYFKDYYDDDSQRLANTLRRLDAENRLYGGW